SPARCQTVKAPMSLPASSAIFSCAHSSYQIDYSKQVFVLCEDVFEFFIHPYAYLMLDAHVQVDRNGFAWHCHLDRGSATAQQVQRDQSRTGIFFHSTLLPDS